MPLFNDEIKKQLSAIVSQLENGVTIVFFTQEIECPACSDTHSFVQEIAGLSDRLTLRIYDLVKDSETAARYGIDKVPAIALLDNADNDYGIRFYGMPGGYEINSFLGALLEISGKKQPLAAPVAGRIAAIKKDIHMQVFVSLSCPYCPGAVSTAHRLALENSHIRADMVESTTFPHLMVKYNVSSVPKTIINETHELIGAQPIEKFLDILEKI